uniref:DH domain-containing protein n=1 Tax=Onchocerca flexuosa TaxID=387005 RepID=A0A183I7D9_9BILA
LNYYFSEASDQPTCSRSLPTRTREDGSADIIGHLQSISQKIFFNKIKSKMLEDLTLLKKDVQMVKPTFKLEAHWSNIVHNSDKLSMQACDQQEAIWEFITTEHQYLQANEIFLLKQMNEFRQYFLKLQEAGHMRDIDSRRIFLNYSELYAHHSKFWENEE